jgi:hypothetical protein
LQARQCKKLLKNASKIRETYPDERQKIWCILSNYLITVYVRVKISGITVLILQSGNDIQSTLSNPDGSGPDILSGLQRVPDYREFELARFKKSRPTSWPNCRKFTVECYKEEARIQIRFKNSVYSRGRKEFLDLPVIPKVDEKITADLTKLEAELWSKIHDFPA